MDQVEIGGLGIAYRQEGEGPHSPVYRDPLSSSFPASAIWSTSKPPTGSTERSDPSSVSTTVGLETPPRCGSGPLVVKPCIGDSNPPGALTRRGQVVHPVVLVPVRLRR